MQIQETVVVVRDIHVAPCLKCGHTDILLTDSNYSSFNTGGGTCKKCKHSETGGVSCNPSMQDLARIWNAGNDIPKLIASEKSKIEQAERRIKELEAMGGATLHVKPLEADDMDDLMTIADYIEAVDRGFLSSDDGSGYWATATGKSSISVNRKQPEWATHVMWFNK